MTTMFWSATVLTVLAVLLAFGFSRHRVLLIATVLAAVVAARIDGGARALQSALAFAPPLWFAAAAMPEARWRTWRNALWLCGAALALSISLHAPAHVAALLDGALLRAWPGANPAIGAGVVVAAAAMWCLVRWVRRGAWPEWVACIALCGGALTLATLQRPERSVAVMVATSAWIVFGLLYGAYRMAFVDALSGLRNRRALDEALEKLSGNFAIAMVDIDHFKSFNDSHGHAAGDVVLRDVAARLRRRGASPYRYGGEEFCVVFEDDAVASAADWLEAARAAIESRAIRIRPIGRDGKPGKPRDVKVTASIGFAERSDKRRSPQEVLTAADKALYKAKAAGRNRVQRA